jgi:signal transduction histidine kinase
MNQAMKNERLAIRQKLIDTYSGEAESLFAERSEKFLAGDIKTISNSTVQSASELFETFTGGEDSLWQGMVIYGKDGRLNFPVLSSEDEIADSNPALGKAWQLEFVEKDFPSAADAYGRLAETSDEGVRDAAMTGRIRCLKKAEKFAEALEACGQLAWPDEKQNRLLAKLIPVQIQREGGRQDRFIAEARLMQIELYQDLSHPDLQKGCEKILKNRFSDLSIDSATKIFLLRRCISVAEQAGLAAKPELAKAIGAAKRAVSAQEVSTLAARNYLYTSSFEGWPEGTFRRIASVGNIYGVHFAAGGRYVLGLVSGEKIAEYWTKAVEGMSERAIFCRVIDNTGQVAAGAKTGQAAPAGERFMSRDLGGNFAGWKVELYFGDSVLSEAAAAKRQRAVYLWTFILVIGSMVVVSGLLTRLMLQQAKLSRLKNDFIATVTHELKTPLASMRVLVETLLDRSAAGESDTKQAEEYLTLISRENERLSRLIDNFLTFSRMERNKQAFDFTRASPADIAKSAVEAVQTKFNNGDCKLILTIDKSAAGGPPSILADKDAMVTVLVNLLDNACKYSYNDKQIELRVFAEGSQVCFSVKDNGIGMNRRVVKKIFDKFYQADDSLSRRAGGCGLGLSIVKFIVDAHKGRIIVKSEPGKGSIFTVKVPAAA